MTSQKPAYIKAFNEGLIKSIKEKLISSISACKLCPRACGVNRLKGETGLCKTGLYAKVASYNPHFGEEAPLVGYYGSGTIFFSNCNLLCNFCQNWDISHEGHGYEVDDEELAAMMIHLQRLGCHNINFVTPSHVVFQIISALEIAIEKGLSIPLVYNTSAYDSVETIKLLDGVFDIYMPDFKFWDKKVAEITCHAGDYPEVARSAILEMHRQVGDLLFDSKGIAKKGLLIRHLVLPQQLSNTKEIMRFISEKISRNTYVNIMPQYRPCGRADEVKELARSLSQEEFDEALAVAREMGIYRVDR
ncbi:MAG: radical SAM protein [Bacteroidales bacterium]|nr:radical SAM protein [Bacteroidales bacterium]